MKADPRNARSFLR